ncbi:class I SAM-dependent methyltransferase [Bradyrhizobium sp. 186]|nr:class I SAM-dependent methyltransferase [Bradyrhizobium sp. 186]
MEAAKARRQAEFDRIKGSPLELIHTEACRVVPTREDMLDTLPKGGVAVEVGVASGDFSEEILKRLKPSKLYLIDAWQDQRFADGLRLVEQKFAQQIREGAIELRRGFSSDVLASFPDGCFDFIYLDTTHAYDLTVRELDISALKSSEHGVIAGHDFSAGNVVVPHVYGVIQATAAFCRERRWRYRHISIDPDTYFSFCLERIPA